MTSTKALETARANHKAFIAASIEFDFGRSNAAPRDEDYGHKNGWYRVGEFNFSTEEVTGEAYDTTQGGWAYL